jgi:hypothetical protein
VSAAMLEVKTAANIAKIFMGRVSIQSKQRFILWKKQLFLYGIGWIRTLVKRCLRLIW